MKRNLEETSRYLQAVSRFFLENRGAPFFLSAEEIDSIKEWKNMGIPLQIVREGIEHCFAAPKNRRGRKSKILSLSFCRPFVLQSYKAYKERKVGGSGTSYRKEDKREKLKKAIEIFLASCPDRFQGIHQVFSRALILISQNAAEELLEDLENEVEALSVGMVSEAEQEQIRTDVISEFTDRSSQEQDRIQHLKLIKYAREKYAIPHIPLYYY
jgi:hypothetical protein